MTRETQCHIGEMREAPEPQPAEPLDQAHIEALHAGWRVLAGEGPALSSFASFKAGVLAYEEALRKRYRSALRDVR